MNTLTFLLTALLILISLLVILKIIEKVFTSLAENQITIVKNQKLILEKIEKIEKIKEKR